jgi:hypothetical protein
MIISKYIQCKIDSKSFAGEALSGIFKHLSGPYWRKWHSRGRRFDPDQLHHLKSMAYKFAIFPSPGTAANFLLIGKAI